MFSHPSASYAPRAPRPAYPYQQPSSYDLMLASQSASTLSSSTPSLVARSLASTPSSSTFPEADGVRNLPSDESEILYATGLDHLDLNEEDTIRWSTRLQQDEIIPKTNAAQTNQPSPSFVPNPHAQPYIPTIVRRRANADPVSCGIDGVSWQPHREWLRPFRAGSVTSYAGVRQAYAQDIVSAGPWDTAIMSELAARFVERVAEGCSETLAHVAPLASEVHRCFRDGVGEGVATSFIELLKQHLLSEFRAWWLSALPSSVVNILSCSPSPPHAPPFRSVSSAIAVATFVGDLFAEGLIKGSFVQLCMNMIIDKLSVLEEVEALHAIVLHSGERLYDRVPLSDFQANLQLRCMNVPMMSVAGKMNVLHDAQCHVQAITTLVESWAAARATPAPSEFSEPSSEYSDYNPEHTIHRHTRDDGHPASLEEFSPFRYTSAPDAALSSKQQSSAERRWADIVKA
ncbi:hypothetical protein PHLGIDRAFT_129634 [Phlebiopsis gigantea 11061_1 CR5-6]|uniref:Uncharacterized protein n=1 Tax=Phlebiopsis gigantea (strain 11061_1 CR5-6) TaxID=745531 RepID=A0A0C3PFA5_PHLG1|nr:hypothetical protein PHLGIDRAFT_129634 [Phlebiopsis gigantea 11061_1 CR5-6]